MKYSQDGMYRYRKSMKAFKEFAGDVVFTPRLSVAFLTRMLGKGEGFSQRGINSRSNLEMKRRALEKVEEKAIPDTPDWTSDNGLMEFLKNLGRQK